MKIIDLLNKIANGEEVPKKIKYGLTEWFYDRDAKDYFKANDNVVSFQMTYVSNPKWLNLEVEIIEEDKKIEEIGSWYEILEQESKKTQLEEINHNFYKIFDRLEQLIDEVNKLKENK